MVLFTVTRRWRPRRCAVYAGFTFLSCYATMLLLVGRSIFMANLQALRENQKLRIWPEEDPDSDRILQQLSYIPAAKKNRTIVIFLAQSASSWYVKTGDLVFRQQCKVSNCLISDGRGDNYTARTADVVMFRHRVERTPRARPPGQIWVLYNLENPFNTPSYKDIPGQINYTATYRFDSDIVTPYEKYVDYVDSSMPAKDNSDIKKNYAAGKTKKVAWFVSNCNDKNGRLEYAHALSKYISVDIYGGCGDLSCDRSHSDDCFKMLDDDYKFYLSFENANCRDYITEKFFVNGLQRTVVPIVMGASRREYERVAPEHSFIHVDDFDGPKQLAEFLTALDEDDAKYNEYFRWKENAGGLFINTRFWCRLCSIVNDPKPKIYEDVDSWWRGPDVCSPRGKPMPM